jgi:diadenosine tetraphosphate (Ap4A) HIT family hydrolase
VVVSRHVREMTDLDPAQLARVMATVYAVEDALRAVLEPDKMNVASLGNQVPHLHWHVIPRFFDDAHFPQPIWGTRQREPDAEALARRRALLPAVAEEIRSRVAVRAAT